MRKILFLIALTAFCLIGCLDSQEDVTINANGSGTYKSTIDMSGLFDMLQMAAMMDTSANNALQKFSDKNLDSTLLFRSFTDTSSTLTPEEKALLRDATMHININQKEKQFKVNMTYPFKKMDDLQKILELQKSNKGFNPFKKPTEDSSFSALGGGDEAGLPNPDQVMNISYKNGLIERKLDQQKLDSLKAKEQNSPMQGMDEMMTSVTFGTVIHLPRAVKNATGEKITLSDDKKTVRINYTLADLKKNPKSLEFKIEY